MMEVATRSKLSLFEKKPNILKFHPLIDMNEQGAGIHGGQIIAEGNAKRSLF
ncbi:hypothetical protein N9Y26_00860 [bacterium]|nr:hypothetical protein [bacterium]